ncbi:MAG: FdhF/YdeP family oxidoreductase [Bacteroidetes bacterium]|nr:FdhF/YdeP family oxidoreductase [Bacteroidota bacterium]
MPGKKEQASAENPEKLNDLHVTEIEKWAVGAPAIISSIKDVVQEPGVIRGVKGLLKMNQKDGFDCPSCAWPDPDDDRHTIAEYCENGVKALAEEATTKKLTAQFFAEHSVADLANLSDMEIGKLGRLTQPMHLPYGSTHYQPITWDDAFQKIGEHLNALPSPHEAVFYTSGRTSNEASFVYQLFVRELGTNNFPDCSNMCHEASGTSLSQTVGLGKGTVRLNDFYDTDAIIIIGQNPGTNAPRMLSALEKGKKSGAKIIAINPLPEAGLMGFKNPQKVRGFLFSPVKLADLYLQVKINEDLALLKAIEKLLYEAEKITPGEVFDHDFIKKNTVGYDSLIEHLESCNPDTLAQTAGVPLEQVQQVVDIIKHKKRIIWVWGMGITQHRNGVDTINEIVNLALLKGSVGKPGAGLCPVRGHSNVQGNRTLMIWERPKQEQLDKLKSVFGFEPPREPGYDVVDSIKAMNNGNVKVFFGMGGNFLSATPDTGYTAEALRKLKLTVNVSTKLNRSHLVHGEESIILPTLSRSDKDIVNDELQFVSTENSMGVVQLSKGMLDPVAKNLLNETQIVCRLAKATLGKRTVIDWDGYANSYDKVRDDIEKVIPGFNDYNKRVRQPGGFYLPNGPREGKFNSVKFSGKASFTINKLSKRTLESDEYLMASIRSHDQFNTTIYGLEDRYRGVNNERRVLFMNEKDMKKDGFAAGDRVDLFSYYDGVERCARLFIIVPYNIPEQNTATYYPETNVLMSINSVDPESNMPAAKSIVIKVKPHHSKQKQ